MRYRLKEMWQAYERIHGKKLTWRELAQKSELTIHAIQRVENNESVTTRTLEKLARALECKISDLIDEDD